jgi:hypothetical protein
VILSLIIGVIGVIGPFTIDSGKSIIRDGCACIFPGGNSSLFLNVAGHVRKEV